MKVFFVLSVVVISIQTVLAKPLEVNLHSQAAIVINYDTGAILYEKNAYEVLFPASITKVATAAYALSQNGHLLNSSVTADQNCIGSISSDVKRKSNYQTPAHWLEVGSSHMGIKKGETLTLEQLMYGMMLVSANDAANTIAQHVSGSINHFMDELNLFLKDLGCQHTHFVNPHGLHHPSHVTSAYDMALMTRYAMKHPIFRQIVSTTRFLRTKTNKQEETWLASTNALIKPGTCYYPKAIGIKTGYTAAAQNTLVAAATEGDRTLVVVLLGANDSKLRFEDAVNLFEAAFQESLMTKAFLRAGPQKFQVKIDGAKRSLNSYLEEDLALTFYPSESPKVKGKVCWDSLILPIEKGQRVGEVRLVTESDNVLAVATLFADKKITSSRWRFR